MNEWTVVLLTYSLAAVVSLFVAVAIHLMGICIRRFSPPGYEIPAAASNVSQQGGSAPMPSAVRDQEAEVAAAVAAVKAYIDKHS